MFKLRKKKLVNESYLTEEKEDHIVIDNAHRLSIDMFIEKNYAKLVDKCSRINDISDDKGMCALDILNQCIINLYERPLSFADQAECNLYCTNYINKCLRKIYERKRYIQRINHLLEMAHSTESEDTRESCM